MTIQTIREGIAKNLGGISGLRVMPFIPDNPTPPIAVVQVAGIDFDSTFHRGAHAHRYEVVVIASRTSERGAQAAIDSYCDPSGSTSIKAAVESDPTLSGAAFDARVTEMSNYGPLAIGDVQYLSATFSVSVIAN